MLTVRVKSGLNETLSHAVFIDLHVFLPIRLVCSEPAAFARLDLVKERRGITSSRRRTIVSDLPFCTSELKPD